MTVAVIADVHGNRWALDAVIADARARGATTFLDLGDTTDGPLAPDATARRLIELGAITVRGNHDRMVIESDPDTYVGDPSPEQLDWLRSLPFSAGFEDIYLVHATPQNDRDFLLETIGPDGVVGRPLDQVTERLEGIDASLILCGHSHLPRLYELADGRHVLNPGSVGQQAIAAPGWAIGNGSPHARYVLLERTADGRWRHEQRHVAYDWNAAANAARAAGDEVWAALLTTGWPALRS